MSFKRISNVALQKSSKNEITHTYTHMSIQFFLRETKFRDLQNTRRTEISDGRQKK